MNTIEIPVLDKVVPQECLAFRLGAEEYGIDIMTVQEIRGYKIDTAIVDAPEFMKGVLNWRDYVIPILDMRIKFGTQDYVYDEETCIIVLEIEDRFVGIVVDSVSDVISLNPDQIRSAPDMGTLVNTDSLLGLGTLEDKMFLLLDIRNLLRAEGFEIAGITQ